MKAMVTGTETRLTRQQVRVLLRLLKVGLDVDELHHGDCVGADATAHRIAGDLGIRRVVHPPKVPASAKDKGARANSLRAWCHGEEERALKDYIERNHDMVDETEVVIALPRQVREWQRDGTWATVRYARKLGRRIVIVYPNGKIELEGDVSWTTG